MLVDWSKPLRIVDLPDHTVTVLDANYRYNELGTVILLKIGQPGKADRLTARHPMSNECPMQTDPLRKLVIENAPVIDRGFYPLDYRGAPFGRGLVLLPLVWSEHPDATHAVEIVREDGKPKEVHLHVREQQAA